ncbi:hypothetical protein PNEG_00960 [Pneumocystis murina B123]|uniref:Rab-GAP TBC domain-containing protein n=1 Tax=Pneumocystis murina (strain B123) TaxID=1069680 RepID=M7NQ39_PNEMU|nr:hypothetical protein PNEG_00960 [Pneumocystis murina B123]EMR10813.1 hypothetical protein PNEG_00960 [Pneumocystis murina B123]
MGFVFLRDEKGSSNENLRSEKNGKKHSNTKEESYPHIGISKTQKSLLSSKSLYNFQSKGIMPLASLYKGNSSSFSDYVSQTDDDWGINIEDEKEFLQLFKTKNELSQLSIYDKISNTYEKPFNLNEEKKELESKLPKNKEITDIHNFLSFKGQYPPLEKKCDIGNKNTDFYIVKVERFSQILQETSIDLNTLRKYAWNGIPDEFRPIVWKLLMGYLPCNASRREATLSRKRNEYLKSVSQTYEKGIKELDQAIWHQIHIDVLRTNPTIKLYQYETTQKCLEKILYVWVIRHPASGYVQGINDLVTPFFQVFLSEYIDGDPEIYDPSDLPKDTLDIIEADTFWCISKLLDSIQDNYVFAQPGIHRQIINLKELITRIDHQLSNHLEKEGVEYIQFSFRWMNCMLMREMSVKNTIRMWDTYMAEGQSGFSDFHVYVCAAFLVKWSPQLLKMDFQEIIIFLQSLPTQHWTYKDIEILLSEAFLWKSLFSGAKAHLR